MPNIKKETGIADAPWERIRTAMVGINAERHAIRNAERRIAGYTMEIYHVLWPQTDKKLSRQSGSLKRPSFKS